SVAARLAPRERRAPRGARHSESRPAQWAPGARRICAVALRCRRATSRSYGSRRAGADVAPRAVTTHARRNRPAMEERPMRLQILVALSGIAVLLKTLSAVPVDAGCGCNKPPPPLAPIRPAFGSPGDTVTVFPSGIVPG